MSLERSFSLAFCVSLAACGDAGSGQTGGAAAGGGVPIGGEEPAGGMAAAQGGSQTGGADTGGAAAGGAPGIGPYIDCKQETIECPTEGAICPWDSTGSICAPPCETAADCPALPGAQNDPECYEVAVGKFCIIPCGLTAECPAGMECLSIGLDVQCGWP